MTLVSEVDAAATGTVVVFGSLPPEGRDLDLVVRPPDEEALTAWLEAAGFRASGRTWARFGPETAEAVEVVNVRRWQLADSAAERLFADAIALPGCRHVARPAPHHALLILARRLVREGSLDDRRLARAVAAVEEDPSAWDRAEQEAPGWRAVPAVALLRATVAAADAGSPDRPAVHERVRALGAELGDGVEGTLRAVRTVATPRRRGAVVALSGLDGSGKTTQVDALVRALGEVGVDATRVWSRLSFNPRLWRLGALAKRVLRVVARRRRSAGSAPLPSDVDPSRVDDPLRRLRYDSDLLTWVWSTLVTVENGWAHRRQTRALVARGQVAVCDRYALDSAVHLRYRYGESRRFPFQRLVLRWLSPVPAAAFFLDVPGSVAAARKADQYDAAQLDRQVRLYREECERWGVVRLDGQRPPDELAMEIAQAVWPALRASGRRRFPRR